MNQTTALLIALVVAAVAIFGIFSLSHREEPATVSESTLIATDTPYLIATTSTEQEEQSTTTAPASVPKKPAASTTAITPDNVLAAVNAARRANGLKPLVRNSKLTDAAIAHLADMVAENYFSHDLPQGGDYNVYVDEFGYPRWWSGENLGRGFGTINDLFDAWMASAPHRANILKPEYTDTGIAVGGGVVVEIFGSTGS